MKLQIIKQMLAWLMFSAFPLMPESAFAAECAAVADELNSRLQHRQPGPLMEAGSMYEYGDCVEKDWEKAAQFFQQAQAAGAKQALPRLVALFAVQNRDPAAAMWWAVQGSFMLPKTCIPTTDPLKDSIGFVDELRTWAGSKLGACVYHAGIMSRVLIGTTGLPGVNALPNRHGTHYNTNVDVFINVVAGTIEWFDQEEKEIGMSRVLWNNLETDMSSQPAGGSPLSSLWWIGVSALKEFGKPPSDDPSFSAKNTLVIQRVRQRSRIRIDVDVVQ